MTPVVEGHVEGQFQGRYLPDGEHKGRSILFVGGYIQHAIPSCRSSVGTEKGQEKSTRGRTSQAITLSNM